MSGAMIPIRIMLLPLLLLYRNPVANAACNDVRIENVICTVVGYIV